MTLRAGIDCDYVGWDGEPIERSAHCCVLIKDGHVINVEICSAGPTGLTTMPGYMYAELFCVHHPRFFSEAADHAREQYEQLYPELAKRFPCARF